MTKNLNLKLHRKQFEIFYSQSRVKVVTAGRGFGKSILLLVLAIHFCLSWKGEINPSSPATAMICFPTLKMARAIAWIPLINLLDNLPIVESVNRSDFRIVFKGKRPDLIIRGADNGGEKLRGLNLVWVGLDEYQDFAPTTWNEVLLPALTRNKDWSALIIGTPKGKSTHFYKFHQEAIANPDYTYFHAVTADNPFIPTKEIERAKTILPPKTFRQEYEASWEDFDGQIFDQLDESALETEVPTNFDGIYIGVDWGDINPAIVAVGLIDNHYYLIDYWCNPDSTPKTEVEIKQHCADLCFQYEAYRCYLPDDRPASILAFRRYGKQKDVSGMRRAVQVRRSNPGVMERAGIINSIAYQKRLHFLPRCHPLYQDFQSYHRDKDSLGNLLNKPAPRQNDHTIDAVAYVIGQLEPELEKRILKSI